MSLFRESNRRYLLHKWVPALAVIGVFGVFGGLTLAALLSGDPQRAIPGAIGLLFAAGVLATAPMRAERKTIRALQLADPQACLNAMGVTSERLRGNFILAANAAIIFAHYGRLDVARRVIASTSWRDAPPLLQAQGCIARAMVAHHEGHYAEAQAQIADAALLGEVDKWFPGAASSARGYRLHHNLGLALAGSATDDTVQELRAAFARRPTFIKLYAAWALAVIAKRRGDTGQLQAMRQFIASRAPHFRLVLASIDSPYE